MGTSNRCPGVLIPLVFSLIMHLTYGQQVQQVHQQAPPGVAPQQPMHHQQQQQQPPPGVPPQQMQQQQVPPVHIQQQQQQQMHHQQPPPGVPPQQMHHQQPPPGVPPQQMHHQQQVPPAHIQQQQQQQQMHHQQPPPGVPPQQMHHQQPPPGVPPHHQQQMHQQQVPVQQHMQMPPQHQQQPPSVHQAAAAAAGSMERPWYENLPAVAMDYKVHVDAGKEDCYFQYVQPGAAFYVSFQVVRGGDGMAGFAVRHPNGQIVHPYQWQANAEYGDQQSTGGYYSVCVDNQFSRFAGKLINLYLTVIKYDEWDKYTKEIEAMQLNMDNFTSTIKTVERNINDMQQFQMHTRNRESRDAALLEDNNSYVQNWSLIQIIVITMTTTLQVYFVRKLFQVKSGPGGRSRI